MPYDKTEFKELRFQLPELESIRFNLISAAYKGELNATFFQN
jgi:hypothetical protein